MAGRSITVGISGGIAAFKTAALVSQLVQAGHEVTVIMTSAATRFVGPDTFAALTGRRVLLETFDADHPLGAHLAVQSSQLLCVAPATANFLAKAATGLADDLLSTAYLAFSGPVVLAPAMNCDMWAKPAVQRNVRQLQADGVIIVDPEEGWLSCRAVGAGRMASPERILKQLLAVSF